MRVSEARLEDCLLVLEPTTIAHDSLDILGSLTKRVAWIWRPFFWWVVVRRLGK